MTLRDKRQRTFKFSGSTETQLAQVCHATGSSVTAVVEQAVAHYYRDLFGSGALLSFAALEQAPREGSAVNDILKGVAHGGQQAAAPEKQVEMF